MEIRVGDVAYCATLSCSYNQCHMKGQGSPLAWPESDTLVQSLIGPKSRRHQPVIHYTTYFIGCPVMPNKLYKDQINSRDTVFPLIDLVVVVLFCFVFTKPLHLVSGF